MRQRSGTLLSLCSPKQLLFPRVWGLYLVPQSIWTHLHGATRGPFVHFPIGNVNYRINWQKFHAKEGAAALAGRRSRGKWFPEHLQTFEVFTLLIRANIRASSSSSKMIAFPDGSSRGGLQRRCGCGTCLCTHPGGDHPPRSALGQLLVAPCSQLSLPAVTLTRLFCSSVL